MYRMRQTLSANPGTHVLVWMLNQAFENTAKQGANSRKGDRPFAHAPKFHENTGYSTRYE